MAKKDQLKRDRKFIESLEWDVASLSRELTGLAAELPILRARVVAIEKRTNELPDLIARKRHELEQRRNSFTIHQERRKKEEKMEKLSKEMALLQREMDSLS